MRQGQPGALHAAGKNGLLIDSTCVRAHPCAAGAAGSSLEAEALGRSRGGFGTKIHAITDALGNPLDFVLTGSQAKAILVDRGEAEAIALAMEIPGSTVLLEDSQARRVAERLGVQRVGTLGLLRKAKREGFVDAIALLRRGVAQPGDLFAARTGRGRAARCGEAS